MAEIVCARMNWDRTALPIKTLNYYDMHVSPEPGFPFGRKGLVISSTWRQLASRNASGLLILDGDVAIDPADHGAMLLAIDAAPALVHTAPVKIWPRSTRRRQWTWSHWRDEPGQALELRPVYFSFCYTYLPRMLLVQAERDGLKRWAYPGVDTRMSECAARSNIAARLVPGCWPKHVNY